MDNFDDWRFRRDFHTAMGGSVSLAFSKQAMFDRREHFESTLAALEQLGRHAPHRPVQLEIQFEAYFLSLYACLEFSTISVCHDLAETLRLPISYDDVRGNSAFDRALIYFKLVEPERTFNPQIARTLAKYQIVRNAIAHGVGVENLVGEKRKQLSPLIGWVVDPEDDSRRISLEFCSAFYEFAEQYLDELEAFLKSLL